MAAWWLDYYRAQGLPELPVPEADLPYAHGTTPSRYGYCTPLGDAVIEKWEVAGGNDLRMLQWLLTGHYESGWQNVSNLRNPSNVGGGFLKHIVPTTTVPDLNAYIGKRETDFTQQGNTPEDVRACFSEYLLDVLARGPMAIDIPSHMLTLWGADFKYGIYRGEKRLLVSRLYIADNDRYENESTAPRLEPYNVLFSKPIGSPDVKPMLEGYKAASHILGLRPLFAYGKNIPEGGTTDPKPDPEPEPEPAPDPEPGQPQAPAPDPEIPDDDLGGHYPYTLSRSFWKARKLALEQKKALFVLSGADWCSYCSRVKNHLETVEGFARDFVVYYASREGAPISPYFHGGLPEYGAFDPRKANPFAGTIGPDGQRVWANAWVHPDNGAYDAQRGYDPARIDACIRAAREQWAPELAEPTAISLSGGDFAVVGEPTPYTLTATFIDSVEMALTHRVAWEVTNGPAMITPEGLLTASAPGDITIRATSFHDFEGVTAERTLKAIPKDRIAGLVLTEQTFNLEDTPTPRILCHMKLEDGTLVPMVPESWTVVLAAPETWPSGGFFEYGYDLEPRLSATGELTYSERGKPATRSVAIRDHKIRVTAKWGSHTAERDFTVYGPTQVLPTFIATLSPRRVSPGSVVRLKHPPLYLWRCHARDHQHPHGRLPNRTHPPQWRYCHQLRHRLASRHPHNGNNPRSHHTHSKYTHTKSRWFLWRMDAQ